MELSGLISPTTFVLTEDHIKLLTRTYISWEDCEYGAPAIDCKRPYGNSFVVGDVAEILGWADFEHMSDEDAEDFYACNGKWAEIYERAETIHKETQIALQIVLQNKTFKPGIYARETSWESDWNIVESA